jgi:hypothetical protein
MTTMLYLPVEFQPDWTPLTGFSVLNFGAQIDVMAHHLVEQPMPESASPLKKRFFSEDLSCDIITVDGKIHEITCRSVCNLDGYNLVGSNLARVKDILGNPIWEWRHPEPDDPMERLGTSEALGITIYVVELNQVVHEATLRGHRRAHLERERLLATWPPNVIPMVRPRTKPFILGIK